MNEHLHDLYKKMLCLECSVLSCVRLTNGNVYITFDSSVFSVMLSPGDE